MATPHRKKGGRTTSAPSGDETRQRLVDAGIEVFGRFGYEAATTRMLARTAGVNLAAIPYHFGGKEGLYHAVVQHIGGRVFEALDEERSMVFAAVGNPDASRDELLGALEAIIRGFGRILISSDLGRQFAPIIIREQVHPTSAFEPLYEGQIRPIHEAVTVLVARLSGVSPENEEAVLRAHAIIGQVVAFRAMRETAQRRLGWKVFDEIRTMNVCDVLVANMRRILNPQDERAP